MKIGEPFSKPRSSETSRIADEDVGPHIQPLFRRFLDAVALQSIQSIKKGSLAGVALGACAAIVSFQSQPQVTNAGYLKAGACAACHEAVAESYARTGMARSFGKVQAQGIFPELAAGAFHHEGSEQFFSVYQRGGKPYLKRHQIGFDGPATNVLEASIDYWFGSGNHARSFLNRTKSQEFVELPITWYTEKGGFWAMSPGYDRPDHAGFSRNITYRCMFCHSGYPEVATEASGGEGTHFPDPVPEGIDCQRCHGAGQDHVDAVRQRLSLEQVRSSIVNPARLSLDRQMEVCMQCHLETTSLRLPAAALRYGRGVFSYRPGEPLENYVLHFDRAPGSGSDRFEFASSAYRLRQSECYRASRGALTCTTCHNPHEPSDSPAAASRHLEACQRCHRATVEKLLAERRHPVSQDCASCHMPKRRPSDAIHVMVTDHFIRKRPEADPPGPLIERHDGNTPPYRGEVVLYYPSKLAKTPENELSMAVAQVKHEANLDEGLRKLEGAIAQHSPTGPRFYFELAEGFRHAGKLDRAIAFYEQACSRTPLDWRAFYRLGTTLSAVGNLDRAAPALERARALAPNESAVLEAVANVLSRRGRLSEAVATLQKAVAMDPTSAFVQGNLGARLLQLGDAAGAEKAWRESLRLRPESATMHLNLANLLSGHGSFAEAQYHFKSAIRIDGAFADARSAYARALAARGDLGEARGQYEAALRLKPGLAGTHNELGNVLLRMGDQKGAIREYREGLALNPDSATAYFDLGLVLAGEGDVGNAEKHFRQAIHLAPNYFEAHLKLGQILFRRGQTAQAVPHLRRAAESPDANLRNAANALLMSK